MKCRLHYSVDALGACHFCKTPVCFDCAARMSPHLVCTTCAARGVTTGFEYRTSASIGGWPLLHVCAAYDAGSMTPKPARGVIAIGPVAFGGLAIGGVACGLVSLGGASIGLVAAVGGAAIGTGLSVGGLAIGATAVGGLAIGLLHAVGGVALAPSVITETRCDSEARELVLRWLGSAWLPPSCGPR